MPRGEQKVKNADKIIAKENSWKSNSHLNRPISFVSNKRSKVAQKNTNYTKLTNMKEIKVYQESKFILSKIGDYFW